VDVAASALDLVLRPQGQFGSVHAYVHLT
jgi:hypothetical protein